MSCDPISFPRSEPCSTREVQWAFELLGRRWTAVILGTLSDRPASFRGLARAVPGISDSMLSTRLAALTKAGLLTRVVDEGPPLSVAYQLTDAGCVLLPALDQISRWAEEHLPPAGFVGKALRPAWAKNEGIDTSPSRRVSTRRRQRTPDGTAESPTESRHILVTPRHTSTRPDVSASAHFRESTRTPHKVACLTLG